MTPQQVGKTLDDAGCQRSRTNPPRRRSPGFVVKRDRFRSPGAILVGHVTTIGEEQDRETLLEARTKAAQEYLEALQGRFTCRVVSRHGIPMVLVYGMKN